MVIEIIIVSRERERGEERKKYLRPKKVCCLSQTFYMHVHTHDGLE